MGIQSLLQNRFVKEVVEKKSLAELSNKVAAVDVSCWLHKSLSLSEPGDMER